MRSLRIAFGLMTTLPFRLPQDWLPGDSGRASVWYPLVGVVVGALTWLVWRGALFAFPPFVAGVITLVAWGGLTGGLHLDGLADCCDGLLASVPVARRLEIMKDPRLGTFGGVGLIFVLLLKAASLAALAPGMGLGILLAASLGRGCILLAGLLPPARPSGMGADFATGFRRAFIFIGAVLPLGLALACGERGLIALLAGVGSAALLLWLAKSRIGGVTGDVFGAVVEVVETVVLLAFVARLS